MGSDFGQPQGSLEDQPKGRGTDYIPVRVDACRERSSSGPKGLVVTHPCPLAWWSPCRLRGCSCLYSLWLD